MIFQYFPGQGPAAAPAGELRQAQRLLVWASATGTCARWRTTSCRSCRRAQRLSDLGVLLRLRRRVAAVDLRHGAGNRDAGAGARAQPLNDPALLEVAGARRGAFERSTPTGVRVPAGRGRLVRALQLRAAPVRAERACSRRSTGIRTYAEFAPADTAAAARFRGRRCAARRGIAELRHRRLVALLAAVVESRAPRRTSTTTRSTATSRATSAAARPTRYCEAADHFTRVPEGGPDARPARRRPVSGRRGQAA